MKRNTYFANMLALYLKCLGIWNASSITWLRYSPQPSMVVCESEMSWFVTGGRAVVKRWGTPLGQGVSLLPRIQCWQRRVFAMLSSAFNESPWVIPQQCCRHLSVYYIFFFSYKLSLGCSRCIPVMLIIKQKEQSQCLCTLFILFVFQLVNLINGWMLQCDVFKASFKGVLCFVLFLEGMLRMLLTSCARLESVPCRFSLFGVKLAME